MHPSRRHFFLMSGIAAAQAQVRKPSNSIQPRYRALGKTGLRVTELGFATEGISDPSVIARGIDLGINFFDTAHAYEGGNNERYLGQALKGRRKDVIVASRTYANNAAGMRANLDQSLRELGTDYLDLWYIGNKDKAADVTGDMLEVQRAAQKAGKIRFRAFSTHRLVNLMDFILTNKFDVVMIPYSFAQGTPRDRGRFPVAGLDNALGRLKQAGIGVVAMKVMGGNYTMKPGGHVAAIRWVLKTDRIATMALRMADHDQVIEDVKAMTGGFTANDEKLLAAQSERIRPVLCRMCGACDGVCPKGLPASDIVRFVMYADGYGDKAMARSRFRALPEAVREVRCGDCESCPISCPNGVRVRDQLTRAQTLLA